MRVRHSFYLLDIDCVTSLKGLLTYIAERIQLGYLCLFCNKMFRNARRCQQHMMDKSHCFMNVDDEHEYEQYYDFSQTYEGHPEAASEEGKEKKTPLLTKKTKDDVEEVEGDGWEDVDVEDAGSGEEVESSDESAEDKKEPEGPKTDSEFSIISEGQDKSGPTSVPF